MLPEHTATRFQTAFSYSARCVLNRTFESASWLRLETGGVCIRRDATGAGQLLSG